LSTAAIIVHYRTPERLRACIDALRGQTAPPQQIVVVDNSGTDRAAPEPPTGAGWTVLRSGRNDGYGAACNRGARACNEGQLLFMNADLVLDVDACAQLDACAAAHPAAAVFGPRIFGADGEIELSARAFPRLRTGVLGRSSLATRLLRTVAGTPPSVAMALTGSTREVDWVSGACMLVRRGAFDRVGGFDEAYWMYWEDADLCRRLRNEELATMICVEAVAHHATGSSGQTTRSISAFHDSAARYYEQHVARGRGSAHAARLLLRARERLVIARLGKWRSRG
jgi:GT2 family glycosyltransferase